jgi:hypothetical protein
MSGDFLPTVKVADLKQLLFDLLTDCAAAGQLHVAVLFGGTLEQGFDFRGNLGTILLLQCLQIIFAEQLLVPLGEFRPFVD